MKQFSRYSKKTFYFQLVLSLLSAVVTVVIPLLEAELINGLVYRKISDYFFLIAACAILAFFFKLFLSYFIARNEHVGSSVVKFSSYTDLLELIYGKNSKELVEYDRHYLNSRINADLESIINFLIFTTPQAAQSMVTILFTLILLSLLNPKVLILVLFLSVIYIMIYLANKNSMYALFDKIREEDSLYEARKSQIFQRLFTTKMLSLEKLEIRRLSSDYKNLLVDIKKMFNKRYLASTSQIVLAFLFQLLYFWLEGMDVVNGLLSIGIFTATIQYFNGIINSLDTFFDLGIQVQEYSSAKRRIGDLISLPEEIEGEQTVTSIDSVELRDFNILHSQTQEQMYQQNLNVQLTKGSIYHLKGRNGIGKTTLVKLLVGLKLNDYEGAILFNGISLDSLNTSRLRREWISFNVYTHYAADLKVSDILSTYFTFDPDRLEEDTPEWSIYQMFIKGSSGNLLESKIETLSDGKRQLLNLLITLLKPKAELIILDEPFSNIESSLHSELLDILSLLAKDKIIVLISHEDSLNKIRHEISLV